MWQQRNCFYFGCFMWHLRRAAWLAWYMLRLTSPKGPSEVLTTQLHDMHIFFTGLITVTILQVQYWVFLTAQLALLWYPIKAKEWSPYTCRSFKPWNVAKEDVHDAQQTYTNWLLARQNNQQLCTARRLAGFSGIDTGGIGADFHRVTTAMFEALELGQIVRPKPGWIWADEPSRCSLHINSLDCFTEPLSYCMYAPNGTVAEKLAVNHIASGRWVGSSLIEKAAGFSQIKADEFSAKPLDLCHTSILLKKPASWVVGQATALLLTPRPEVKRAVLERYRMVFPHGFHNPQQNRFQEAPADCNVISTHLRSSRSSCHAVTIGVHVRGGVPDLGRHALQLDDVMRQVDAKVAEVEKRGQEVGQVYLCSDTQETNIVSAEHMQAKYPRSFKYIVLPHLNYSTGTEAEYALKNSHVSKLDVFAEYLADIHILASADIFIGSRSNVYILVSMLRFAHYPDRPREDTGYFETRQMPPIWFNESGPFGTPIWRENEAFDGGSSFW
jgi:hypothetical protein